MVRLLACSLLFCILSFPAHAWGALGHRVVALIAEKHLTDEASDAVKELLAIEGKERLSQVSTWADAMKSVLFVGQPSHVVWLPLDYSVYDAAKHCEKNRCAVGAIETAVSVIRDKNAPLAARSVSLKYLVHLVGDIHQPLHAAPGHGQHLVDVEGKVVSFHTYWDGELIRQQKKGARQLANEINLGVAAETVDLGTVPEWAMESRDVARDLIFSQVNFKTSSGPMTMGPDIRDVHWSIAEVRLKKAGLRLAWLVNDALR
jgi:hypothetical protein